MTSSTLRSLVKCRVCKKPVMQSLDSYEWYHVGKTPPHVAEPGCPGGQCGHDFILHTRNHGCWEDDCMCEARP